jgi:hypothetical protein
VERLLSIRSEPPGARVYVNGEEAGATPLEHPFAFYGTFDIALRAPGHLSTRRLEPVRPPWYQVFPLDLVAEHLVPWTVRDRRVLVFRLEPARGDESERAGAMERLRQAERSLEGPRTPPGSP